METRPKIKLHLSSFDKTLEAIGTLMILILWGLALFAYFNLPATIATHFNAAGRADQWGNRATLLFIPVLGTFIFWGLTWLNKYPNIFNYITPITEKNAEQQYTDATRMLRFLKLAVAIIFTLLVLFIYLTTLAKTNGSAYWFLPLVFALTCIPTGYYIIKSLKTK